LENDMGTNGNAPDIEEENILDRLSRLEDDMLLLKLRFKAYVAEHGKRVETATPEEEPKKRR